MLRKNVTVESGAAIELREMTFEEVCAVRDRGKDLPYTWPVEQQLGPEVLGPLGHSEVRRLAEWVYDLTYGTRKSEKNSDTSSSE